MINCKIQPNGALLITAGNTDRREISDNLSEHGFWATLWEIFEPYACNGEFEPFDAGDANPFVGLTSAPCIAESMDYPDDGSKQIIGRFWYYANYMLTCPLDELRTRGRVIFQGA